MAALPDKLRYAFTPSGGYKEGTLYSLVPNDNVGNFEVVRPTSVDRINKDGEVESVPPNVPVLDYSDGGCPKLLTGADDSITGAGDSSTFNSESGVLFADVKGEEGDLSNRRISLSDGSGTSNNRVEINFQSDGNTLRALVGGGGVLSPTPITNINQSIQNKIGVVYSVSGVFLWVNGLMTNSESNVNLPIGLSTLQMIGSSGTQKFIGKTKSIQHWDYLTDEEMESLTGYQSYSAMTSQFNFNTL